MTNLLAAVILVCVVVVVAGGGFFAIDAFRRRRRDRGIDAAHIAVFDRFAKDQNLAVMRQLPAGADLRLFEQRRGLLDAEAVERVIAGRWQEHPTMAAAVRRISPQNQTAAWLTLIIMEAEYDSADALIYRPDLLSSMTGFDSIEDPGSLMRVPAAANDSLGSSVGVLAADFDAGRLWHGESLRRRVEELGDVVLVEIKGRFLAIIWASPPVTVEVLELRLDGAAGLVRRLPREDADSAFTGAVRR